MKTFFLCLLLLLPPLLWAQKEVALTDSIIISGEVTKAGVIRMADIKKLPEQIIGDLVLVNARGESRSTARGLKGVLLKEVLLAAVRLNATNPADWSRFYFVLVASDGFTALYSWNELFNSPTGDRTYLVTEKDGKPVSEMPDRMITLTTSDVQTGRRYVKGLRQIVVSRIP